MPPFLVRDLGRARPVGEITLPRLPSGVFLDVDGVWREARFRPLATLTCGSGRRVSDISFPLRAASGRQQG